MENTRSPFICNFCNEKCSTHEEFCLHLKWHNDNVPKPYICKECDKGYVDIGALERHMKVHLKEKSFSCPNCNIIFKDEQSLKDHSKIHVNTQFSCDICDYVCNSDRSLTVHMIAHSSNKSFKCKQCDFISRSKSSLSRHHGICNQNSYECRDCKLKLYLDQIDLLSMVSEFIYINIYMIITVFFNYGNIYIYLLYL